MWLLQLREVVVGVVHCCQNRKLPRLRRYHYNFLVGWGGLAHTDRQTDRHKDIMKKTQTQRHTTNKEIAAKNVQSWVKKMEGRRERGGRGGMIGVQ